MRTTIAALGKLSEDDLSLTHTIIQPTVDKRTDSRILGNTVTIRKVGETADGIVVRGARVLATLAPYADEQTVYPGQPLPPGATDYALSFAIPLDTPGLKFLCRDSASAPGADPFDKPLSARFDEFVRHMHNCTACREDTEGLLAMLRQEESDAR